MHTSVLVFVLFPILCLAHTTPRTPPKHKQGSAVPRGVYTFDAHPLTAPSSSSLLALPSRSTFKTYSPDVWRKDKDVLYLQVSPTLPSADVCVCM